MAQVAQYAPHITDARVSALLRDVRAGALTEPTGASRSMVGLMLFTVLHAANVCLPIGWAYASQPGAFPFSSSIQPGAGVFIGMAVLQVLLTGLSTFILLGYGSKPEEMAAANDKGAWNIFMVAYALVTIFGMLAAMVTAAFLFSASIPLLIGIFSGAASAATIAALVWVAAWFLAVFQWVFIR